MDDIAYYLERLATMEEIEGNIADCYIAAVEGPEEMPKDVMAALGARDDWDILKGRIFEKLGREYFAVMRKGDST